MKKKLKLYVWEGVLRDYTSGMVAILATSQEEALELLKKAYEPAWEDCKNKKPSVRSTKCVFFVHGGG